MKSAALVLCVSVIAGAACSLITMLIPYDFCGCGDGYGFPLAILYPSHGVDRERTCFDPVSLSVDVLIWASLPACVLTRFVIWRRQRLKQSSRHQFVGS